MYFKIKSWFVVNSEGMDIKGKHFCDRFFQVSVVTWYCDCDMDSYLVSGLNHILNWFWYYFLSIIALMLLICQYDASVEITCPDMSQLLLLCCVSLLILENVLMFDPQLLVQICDYSSNIYVRSSFDLVRVCSIFDLTWDPHLT